MISRMTSRNVPGAAGRLVGTVFLLGVVASAGCGKGGGGSSGGSAGGRPTMPATKGDGLFMAEAPAVVPEELDPDFEAMGVKRLYVAVATISGGKLTPAPPPPNKTLRPTWLTVVGEPGTASALGVDGESFGAAMSAQLKTVVQEARSWAKVEGVHFHFLPSSSQAAALAGFARRVREGLGVPVSVTIPTEAATPDAWKPLAGAADDVVVFAFGRRPETGDRLVDDVSEEFVKSLPFPVRLLVVPGGYGRAGKSADNPDGRRLPDGQIDALSEDRNLDFDFGQVLSKEPGSIYNFKPHPTPSGGASLLGADGGYARFQTLTMFDVLRFVASVSRWGGDRVLGRVFLVDGLPTDGHLLGFPAIKSLLTGKPFAPKLVISARQDGASKGNYDMVLEVANDAPTPTELSHFNNWVQVRAEGAAITNARTGDFDRFELLTDRGQPAPYGRAVIVRMFENFFAPGEKNQVGPIRVSGMSPRAWVSYRLTTPDGKTIDGPEVEIVLRAPTPPPKPTKPAPLKRRR